MMSPVYEVRVFTFILVSEESFSNLNSKSGLFVFQLKLQIWFSRTLILIHVTGSIRNFLGLPELEDNKLLSTLVVETSTIIVS